MAVEKLIGLYSGVGLANPATGVLKLPTVTGTISSVYLDLNGASDGASLFSLKLDGVEVIDSTDLVVADTQDDVTVSGLAIAMTEGSILSLDLVSPLPAGLPDPPWSLIVTYNDAETSATGAETHAATSKATPVDADELPLANSASSFDLFKLTWANLKAGIATYLGYTPASSSTATALAFYEDTDNGTNKVTLISPATIASDKTATLQDRTGTVALTDGYGMPEALLIPAGDETTAITAGTGKVTFRMPYAMTVTAVRASVTTAPTDATIIIDINDSGTTILSTKLFIDATEKTSTTAATAAVISDSALADDAEITIDFDQVGSTIAGAGVKVWLIGTRA